MASALVVNGTTYSFPSPGDQNWGQNVSDWAAAVTSGMLQKAGGTFTLTAEVDFGASFGLKSLYYKTRTASPATAGQVRLARADVISWRNQADGANLDLGPNSSNVLLFNGTALQSAVTVTDTTTIDLTLTGAALSASVIAGSLTNTEISASAVIARSKLAGGAATRVVVNDGSGVMTDLAALTASRALATTAGGLPVAATATAAELDYLAGVTSAIQTQLDARLTKSGGTMTGDLTLSGAPTNTLHAATKQYVDDAIMGLSVHDSVRVATVSAGTLATSFENGDTVDGVVLATGNRILIKNQAAPAENGIYVVAASGAPARATDADTWTELVQAFVVVTAGTANAGTSWVSQTSSGGTLGVTAVTFGQFASAAAYTADGSGIELSGTTFSLELDGTTLSKSGSGLKVADLGITNAQVSASAAIARSKVATGTANRLVYNADTTGAMSDLGAITAARALVSDANGLPSASTVTTTALGFLDATSSVQTQINAQMPKSGGTFTGGVSGTTLALSGAMTGASLDVSGEAECGTLDCIGNAAVGGNLTVTGTLTVDGSAVLTDADIPYQNAITAEVTGSAASTIDITSIPAFDYYQVIVDAKLENFSGTEKIGVRFNNDSASNYTSGNTTAYSSIIYLTDVPENGTSFTGNSGAQAHSYYSFNFSVTNGSSFLKRLTGTGYASDVSLSLSGSVSYKGAMFNVGGSWTNVASQISRMTFSFGNSAQFAVGSKIKIIGFNL